jgi:hypothetical protein
MRLLLHRIENDFSVDRDNERHGKGKKRRVSSFGAGE